MSPETKRIKLLTAGLFFALTLTGCSDSASPNMTSNKPAAANVNAANAEPMNANAPGNAAVNRDSTGNFNKLGVKSMTDPIDLHLGEAIYEWCEERSNYNSQTDLIYIWTESGGRPEDYVKRGVPKLIDKIRQQEYFKDCEKARELVAVDFAPGGRIQKYVHLYDKLAKCRQG